MSSRLMGRNLDTSSLYSCPGLIIGNINAFFHLLEKYLSQGNRCRLLLRIGVGFLPDSFILRLENRPPLAPFFPHTCYRGIYLLQSNLLIVICVDCFLCYCLICLCISLSSLWLSSGVRFCRVYWRVSWRFVVSVLSFFFNVVVRAACFLLPAAMYVIHSMG